MYKRQGIYRISRKGVSFTQMYLSGGPDLMDRGIRFLDPDSGDEMELGKWYDTSVTVSYTHLDVYKRQGRGCIYF